MLNKVSSPTENYDFKWAGKTNKQTQQINIKTDAAYLRKKKGGWLKREIILGKLVVMKLHIFPNVYRDANIIQTELLTPDFFLSCSGNSFLSTETFSLSEKKCHAHLTTLWSIHFLFFRTKVFGLPTKKIYLCS